MTRNSLDLVAHPDSLCLFLLFAIWCKSYSSRLLSASKKIQCFQEVAGRWRDYSGKMQAQHCKNTTFVGPGALMFVNVRNGTGGFWRSPSSFGLPTRAAMP
jgi:hypothetical protein